MSYINYGDFGRKSEPIQGNVIEIQSAEHKQQIIEDAKLSGSLVCVDIWGAFCGPCKQARPAYEALSLKYPSVVFCAEDVQLEITPEATVVPWFQFFGQGYLLEDKKGADINGIERIILKYLQHQPEPQRSPPPQNPKFASGPPPGGYLPGGGYAQGGPSPLPQQQGYKTPGLYARGPPPVESYQNAPNMGSYPTQRPGGNPQINRNQPPAISYDMQRPTRTPHGIRPQPHKPMY